MSKALKTFWGLMMAVFMVSLFLTAVSVFSQDDDQTPNEKEQSPSKFVTNYDKYTDVTEYRNNLRNYPSDVLSPEGNKIGSSFILVGQHQGKEAESGPETISIGFNHYGEDYADCHNIVFLVDDKIVKLPTEKYEPIATFAPIINITVTLTREQLAQFATAKKVEGRLCKTEFVLTDKQLGLIREFALKYPVPVKAKKAVSKPVQE